MTRGTRGWRRSATSIASGVTGCPRQQPHSYDCRYWRRTVSENLPESTRYAFCGEKRSHEPVGARHSRHHDLTDDTATP